MSIDKVEIFVHSHGKPVVEQVALSDMLKDVLSRAGVLLKADDFVFVGEWVQALDDPDSEADTHEPVSIELSIEDVDLVRHKHVHVGSVHRVEVAVRFNGDEKFRRFSPATMVETVTAWAKKRFEMAPGDGAEFVLQLLPDKTQPRPDEHIGELLTPGECKLVFELIRELTPKG